MKKGLPPGKPLISATFGAVRPGMCCIKITKKIDLIITKSVSRFARNTVDTLITIRKLKEHGVEVYFEEQNIYTLDGKGEVLLTIMSSIAQEESRNISENVTWVCASVLLTERCPCLISSLWAVGAEKTERPRLWKRRRRLYARFSGVFWKVQHQRLLPEN